MLRRECDSTTVLEMKTADAKKEKEQRSGTRGLSQLNFFADTEKGNELYMQETENCTRIFAENQRKQLRQRCAGACEW